MAIGKRRLGKGGRAREEHLTAKNTKYANTDFYPKKSKKTSNIQPFKLFYRVSASAAFFRIQLGIESVATI